MSAADWDRLPFWEAMCYRQGIERQFPPSADEAQAPASGGGLTPEGIAELEAAGVSIIRR